MSLSDSVTLTFTEKGSSPHVLVEISVYTECEILIKLTVPHGYVPRVVTHTSTEHLEEEKDCTISDAVNWPM